MDHKILFSYGFRPDNLLKVIPAVEGLSRAYPIKYIISVNRGSDYRGLIKLRDKYPFLDIRIIGFADGEYILIGCGKKIPPFKGPGGDRIAIYTRNLYMLYKY